VNLLEAVSGPVPEGIQPSRRGEKIVSGAFPLKDGKPILHDQPAFPGSFC
jgi:hypothetical protein